MIYLMFYFFFFAVLPFCLGGSSSFASGLTTMQVNEKAFRVLPDNTLLEVPERSAVAKYGEVITVFMKSAMVALSSAVPDSFSLPFEIDI